MGSLYKFRKTPHNRCFGVEIECYPRVPPAEQTYLGFFWCTTDGSIDSYTGREFVSQPLPYDMLTKQIQRLWKQVDTWTIDYRCGLHVHVGRNVWSKEREKEFSLMLKNMTDAEMKGCFGREHNRYARVDREEYEKFRAINLLHTNSYEFRVWAAGDMTWTLEALRRTRDIAAHRGEWTKERLFKICQYTPAKVVHTPPPAVTRVHRNFNVQADNAARYGASLYGLTSLFRDSAEAAPPETQTQIRIRMVREIRNIESCSLVEAMDRCRQRRPDLWVSENGHPI